MIWGGKNQLSRSDEKYSYTFPILFSLVYFEEERVSLDVKK